MSTERYINIWRSVNDIRVQAGEEKFNKILNDIKEKLKGYEKIAVPYRSRAWTLRLDV